MFHSNLISQYLMFSSPSCSPGHHLCIIQRKVSASLHKHQVITYPFQNPSINQSQSFIHYSLQKPSPSGTQSTANQNETSATATHPQRSETRPEQPDTSEQADYNPDRELRGINAVHSAPTRSTHPVPSLHLHAAHSHSPMPTVPLCENQRMADYNPPR
jgi:hypothetical protein